MIFCRLRNVTCLFGLLLVVASLSAGQTASLNCWGKTDFRTRKAKSPIFKSGPHSIHAEVVADAKTSEDGSQTCANVVQIWDAENDAQPRLIFEKKGGENEGVGISFLGWSPNKQSLLIELKEWGYDSDADTVHRVFLFDTKNGKVRELMVNYELTRIFGRDCEFEAIPKRWQSNADLLIRVGKTPLTAHYEQKFCVARPTLYVMNTATGKVRKAMGSQ